MSSFLKYHTPRMVIVRDKWMGCFCIFLTLALFAFVIVYCILFRNQAQDMYVTTGNVLTEVFGRVYGYNTVNNNVEYMDYGDLFDPFQQENALFVPLMIYNIPNQYAGFCGATCTQNTDCPNMPPYSSATCTNNVCQQTNWCPPLSSGTYTTYQLVGIEKMNFYISPFIDFPTITDKIYRTDTSSQFTYYPAPNATIFTIDNLLGMAGANYATLTNIGGLFTIDYYFDCDLDNGGCVSTMQVTQLNNGYVPNPTGLQLQYFRERAYTYTVGTTTYRDYSVYVGIQFLINVQGVGYRFNFNKLVIQLAVLLVCLAIARFITDFILEHFYPKHKRAFFFKNKTFNSVDFSDVKDGIEIIRQERDMDVLDDGHKDDNEYA